MNQNAIRNFCIIAHVDHGKSTLADRLLVLTNTISKEKIGEQFLDSNPISRERGITIKLAPVRMVYKNPKLQIPNPKQNKNSNYKKELEIRNLKLEIPDSEYILNLIDTPGHVDFSYEVVRTLNACEGAILVVDATKGIQAQTVANYNFAKKLNLVIIPAINKIDLPSADIKKVEREIMESFGYEEKNILHISAKTGEGVEKLLETVIQKVPPPQGSIEKPLQGLVFDSVYDGHKGVVIYTRIKNGSLKKGDEILFISDKTKALVLDLGFMHPSFVSEKELTNGEVGFVITNIKDISLAKVGDTITHSSPPLDGSSGQALPGYISVKSFVFLSIYPSSSSEFQDLRKALFTLKLNDAALVFQSENSNIFGPGFRCGFLGLLHAQIVIERIEREFDLDVFPAPPSIEYIVDGKYISNPKDFPLTAQKILEPYIKGEIYTPSEYLGGMIDLIHKRRGESSDIHYFGSQARINFIMPLSSIMYDFYDKLKSLSSGYASFDYEFYEYKESDLIKVEVSVNYKVIPELSFILHKSESDMFARDIVKKLQDTIPRHNFEVNIRAQIGSKVITSEKISALSKNVLAKMSGGDVTRKNKLLDKQKKGKAKMKMIGDVSIPKEAFLSVFKS